MNIGELKQAIRNIPDDTFISLANYFEEGKGKKKKQRREFGEMECFEDYNKKTKIATFRIKPEEVYY